MLKILYCMIGGWRSYWASSSSVWTQLSCGVDRVIQNYLLSVKMVSRREISVEKMKNNRRKQKYYCRECGYNSGRRFNVERHAQRIHTKSIEKECCNIKFFKKSDYYHHIEDRHPNTRSSCFVSKKKYKIYGRMKLLNDFQYKKNITNSVNSCNINDECTIIRRSMRIQQQVIKKVNIKTEDISTESECNESECDKSECNKSKCDESDNDHMDHMDIDYYDYAESEELTNDSHNYQRKDSFNSVSEGYESGRYDRSENNDDSTDDTYYQNNINYFESSRYQKSELDTIENENIFPSIFMDTKINIQENIITKPQLPLKKRILREISNNVNKNSTSKNNKIKIKKTSFNDKENQHPINIFLKKKQGATVVKQSLTVEQSIQMWNTITTYQRDYLRFIDFNLF